MTKEIPQIQVGKVLERIGQAIGAQKNSEISDALGVSRQVFSTWKKRGTVPYERIALFAQEQNLSLDFLIFGKNEESNNSLVKQRKIDTDLFRQVALRLAKATKDIPDGAKLSVTHAALTYNQVISGLNKGLNQEEALCESINFVIELVQTFEIKEPGIDFAEETAAEVLIKAKAEANKLNKHQIDALKKRIDGSIKSGELKDLTSDEAIEILEKQVGLEHELFERTNQELITLIQNIQKQK